MRLKVGGETFHNVGSGNGPVNALDQALRKDLGRYSSYLAGSAAGGLQGAYPHQRHRGGDPRDDRNRPTAQGARWSTVGVSANIVDASFEALTDSICYKLYRDGAPA